ncbi:MAG: hypothetical protein ABF306_11520 [Nocardioides marinisabuli]
MLSLVLAGMTIAVPALVAVYAKAELDGLMGACLAMLPAHYVAPGGLLVALGGAAWSLWWVGWLVVCLWRESCRVSSERRRQRDAVDAATVRMLEPDLVLIDDVRPAVFCLAGPRPCVVVSGAALAVLSGPQLEQVVLHERAHLASRHHRTVLVAHVVARALGGRWGSGVALDRVRELVEMEADDAGAAGARRDLVAAVLSLGATPAAGAAVPRLAATGGGVVERVQRLVVPSAPLGGRERAGVWGGAVGVLSLPLGAAAVPALVAVFLHWCVLVR